MNNTLKRSLWIHAAISPCSLNICPSATRYEMFFLPTELSKDARNEVLSHWMERGNKLQFRLSVFMLNSWFSFVSCQTVQQCFLPTTPPPRQPVPLASAKKRISVRLAIQCIKFRKVFYFFLVCCKMFVMVVINKLLHIVVRQTNGIQCMRINVYMVNLY